MTDTALPYGGAANPNSGWSGSETSRSRAERDDADGTTSRRQRQIITMLAMRGTTGATWSEVAGHFAWHHGQASGGLSNMHKVGAIARLSHDAPGGVRNRSAVYVLPEFIEGRETSPYGRARRAAAASDVSDEDLMAEWVRREVERGDRDDAGEPE